MGDMVPARKVCESGKSGRGRFYGNQVCFSRKEDLVQGKVEHASKAPKGTNTIPWVPQDGYPLKSIHRRAARDHHKEEEAEALSRRRRSWRTTRIDLHWMHLPHSTVPCLAS
jgi:hypothetical protein